MATFAGITLRQGDDYSTALTIEQNGSPVNITGCTLTFHLRAPGGTTDVITPAPTLTLTTPTSGIATLVLTNAQTAALTADSDYRYEIEVVDATAKVSTPVYGLCFVRGDGG